MDAETTTVIEGLKQAVAEHKSAVERLQKEIKSRGDGTVETKTAIDQINKAIDDLKANYEIKMKGIEQAIATGAMRGDQEKPEEKALRMMNEAFRKDLFNKGVNSPERKDYQIEGDNTLGGFTVVPEWGPWFQKVLLELSPIRQDCSVSSISTLETKFPTFTPGSYDSLCEWTEEQVANPTPKKPLDIGQLSIMVRALRCMPSISYDLLNDTAYDVVGEMTRVASDLMSKKESDAFHLGNGNGKPYGILSNADVQANYTITGNATGLGEYSTGAPKRGIQAWVEMLASLKAPYAQGAKWYMTRTTLGAARSLVDGFGHSLIQPDFANGFRETILGLPVVVDPHMPEISTYATTPWPVMLANLKYGYQIVDHRIQTFELLPRGFGGNPDLAFYYMRRRVGGAVRNSEAIRLMKIASA